MTACLAHYGTTLVEEPIADDALADAPLTGQVAEAHRLMGALGFTLLSRNLYPRLGRQWIFSRGDRSDADYVEKDQFSSFAARSRPLGTSRWHIGDTVFRLPEVDTEASRAKLIDAGLATTIDGTDWLRAADGQVYELAERSSDAAVNRTISVWTDPAEIDAVVADLCDLFALSVQLAGEVNDLADAVVLTRSGVGPVTIRLMTPRHGIQLAPRWSNDIFVEQGYSHLRLGAPDRVAVKARFAEVFPDTGDVSYVLVHHLYLELVELAMT
jgi:hypothetical protein